MATGRYADDQGSRLDHDRYRVFLNGELIGDYRSYGNDYALEEIEERVIGCGLVPSGVFMLGNRIELLCDDHSKAKRCLQVWLTE